MSLDRSSSESDESDEDSSDDEVPLNQTIKSNTYSS